MLFEVIGRKLSHRGGITHRTIIRNWVVALQGMRENDTRALLSSVECERSLPMVFRRDVPASGSGIGRCSS